MDAHFCSHICSFLDVLNNIADDLWGYQHYVNIAWMLIFFEIFLKKMFRFSRFRFQTMEKRAKMKNCFIVPWNFKIIHRLKMGDIFLLKCLCTCVCGWVRMCVSVVYA